VVKAGEIIASMLLTWHNLRFFQELMRGLREAVGHGMTAAFAAQFLERYRSAGSVPAAADD
jgi:queuine tRNA-ribosyltransferase